MTSVVSEVLSREWTLKAQSMQRCLIPDLVAVRIGTANGVTQAAREKKQISNKNENGIVDQLSSKLKKWS